MAATFLICIRYWLLEITHENPRTGMVKSWINGFGDIVRPG